LLWRVGLLKNYFIFVLSVVYRHSI